MITNFMVWYLQISFLKSLRSVKPNKWHKFFSTKIHLFSLTQTTVQVIKLYYVEQYITHKHIHDTIVAHYFWHHWNLYDVPHVTEKKKLESIFHQKGYCYLFQRQLVLISSHSLFWLICTEHLDASTLLENVYMFCYSLFFPLVSLLTAGCPACILMCYVSQGEIFSKWQLQNHLLCISGISYNFYLMETTLSSEFLDRLCYNIS